MPLEKALSEQFCIVAAMCCQHCRYCIKTQDSLSGYICANPKIVEYLDSKLGGKCMSLEKQLYIYPTDVCNLYTRQ